jgi:hypothetical protein
MAGPSIGTWVKVRSKSGGTTPRVLAKKFGGGEYQQGQVITQSEYESYKKQRAEGMKKEKPKDTKLKQLTGTPKQVAYADAIRGRLLKKMESTKTDIKEYISTERALGTSDQEILKSLPGKRFGDLYFRSAFTFGNKQIPEFKTPEKYIELIGLGQKHLTSLTGAKSVIDIGTPETLGVFMGNIIQKVKFKG